MRYSLLAPASMAASEEIDREFKSLIARKVDEEREEEQIQKDAKKKK